MTTPTSSAGASSAAFPSLIGAWRHAGGLATRDPRPTSYMRLRSAAVGHEASHPGDKWVSLDDVSPYLVCAVLGAEDPEFFQHRGFWWTQMARAVLQAYATKRPVRGVSTITQQLARNLYLHPGRSVARKLYEALLTRRLERTVHKARILEIYVNVVEWGDDVWGVGAAARHYFGRSTAALDPFESVFLASLLPAPRAPLIGRNLQRAVSSQRRLVAFLYGCGVLSLTEERPLFDRITTVGGALAVGTRLLPALCALRGTPLDSPSDDRRRSSVRDLMANACSYEHRVAYGQLLAAARVDPSRYRDRPMWWGDRPRA